MDQSTYLETKPRYEILDGLRGVAAMTVVAFHLFETYSKGPEYQVLNHGYLAVDFFFVLSGFVIGYAYDDRWGKMSTWSFFKRRLARLHPMVIIGSLLGVILFYFGSCDGFPLVSQTPWWKLLLMFLLGCAMIPAGPKLDIRGWQETYPINGPQWSLMLEYIANILYAFIFRRLGKAALGVLVALAACMTIDVGLNLNLTGLFEHSGSPYTFIGGWGIHGQQLYIAVARLFYPFLCGLLISRIGKFVKVRGGFWWCSLMVFAILVMPRVGGTDPGRFWMNGIYETACILFVFPFIVAMGAGSKVTDSKSMAVCKFLGNISFPLYITHYPLVYIQIAWVSHHKDVPVSQHIMVGIGLFVLAVFMAYALLKLYDEPVRGWLKEHWLKKK